MAKEKQDAEKWSPTNPARCGLPRPGPARPGWRALNGPPTGAGTANCQPRPTNHLPTRQVGARRHLPGTVCLTDTEADLCACAVLTYPALTAHRDICQGRGGARTGVTSPATAGSVACAVWLRAIRKPPRRGLRVLWRVKKWKADQLALRKRVRFVGQDQDRGRGGAVLSLSPSLTPHGLPRLMCGDYGGS
jgi:hypothetical protein